MAARATAVVFAATRGSVEREAERDVLALCGGRLPR
jgi:hypothetical protein